MRLFLAAVDKVEQELRRLGVELSHNVVVGVSGGRDSVALAHYLCGRGHKVILAHVNYRLRGAESDADEAFVLALAAELDAEIHVSRPENFGASAVNIQVEAREVRYAFFEQVKEECRAQWIATAHHLQDSVETALLNFMRGTGIYGMAGIPAERVGVVRPFLQLTSEELNLYVSRHKLVYRTDSSNAGDDYARNRLRHWLHQLPDFSLHKAAASLANLGADASALQWLAHQQVQSHGWGHKIWLRGETDAEHSAAYHALRSAGFSRLQVAQLCASQRAGAILKSATHEAIRVSDGICFYRHITSPAPVELTAVGEYATTDKLQFATMRVAKAQPTSATAAFADGDKLIYPLVIRGWRQADMVGTEAGNKKVAKLLTDVKVNALEKQRTLVVADAVGKVIWVVGHRLSSDVKPTSETSTLVKLEIAFIKN